MGRPPRAGRAPDRGQRPGGVFLCRPADRAGGCAVGLAATRVFGTGRCKMFHVKPLTPIISVPRPFRAAVAVEAGQRAADGAPPGPIDQRCPKSPGAPTRTPALPKHRRIQNKSMPAFTTRNADARCWRNPQGVVMTLTPSPELSPNGSSQGQPSLVAVASAVRPVSGPRPAPRPASAPSPGGRHRPPRTAAWLAWFAAERRRHLQRTPEFGALARVAKIDRDGMLHVGVGRGVGGQAPIDLERLLEVGPKRPRGRSAAP